MNATATIADNDIDLKVYSSKKFNAAIVATISRQFRHSAKAEARVANEDELESSDISAGGALGHRFYRKSLNLRYEKKTYGPQRNHELEIYDFPGIFANVRVRELPRSRLETILDWSLLESTATLRCASLIRINDHGQTLEASKRDSTREC